MSRMLRKTAKETEWDGGLKGQASLRSMMRDKNITRKAYIKAGVSDEDSNIARMRARKNKILGVDLPKYPVRNMLNQIRETIEPSGHKDERFGKAWDKYNPNGASKRRTT